jgi:phospholipid/cholesterol/gamma-HCH transport system substrate-binding protein
MRFTAKQLANIAVVAVLGLVATTWAVVSLAKVRFDDPATVTVQLPASGGALPGGEVTYLGVPVGRVTSAKLVPGALELKLEVRPKGPMAKELRAEVRQKTALGEPYVDLAPAKAGAKPGDPDGAVVPIERTRVPRTLDHLLQQADQLLAGVKAEDLTTLVDAGGGLAGHGDDLRAMTESGARIGKVLSDRKDQLGALLVASAAGTSSASWRPAPSSAPPGPT